MSQIDTYGTENVRNATELKRVVEDWVNKNFNFIHFDVYQKVAGEYGEIIEYIRPISDLEAVEKFLDWIATDDYREHLAEAAEDLDCDPSAVSEEELTSYLLENKIDQIRDYLQEGDPDSNYPMWNTVFEYRYNNPSEEFVEKAQAAGFGIIEGMDLFNTTLFVSGCGYSFYGSHWIPLYLSLFESEARKWANVDFSCV